MTQIYKELEKKLETFKTANEWSDFISMLGALDKTLKKLPCIKDIEKDIPVSLLYKRLNQCLNPTLPAGVHNKVIKTYLTIVDKLKDGERFDSSIMMEDEANKNDNNLEVLEKEMKEENIEKNVNVFNELNACDSIVEAVTINIKDFKSNDNCGMPNSILDNSNESGNTINGENDITNMNNMNNIIDTNSTSTYNNNNNNNNNISNTSNISTAIGIYCISHEQRLFNAYINDKKKIDETDRKGREDILFQKLFLGLFTFFTYSRIQSKQQYLDLVNKILDLNIIFDKYCRNILIGLLPGLEEDPELSKRSNVLILKLLNRMVDSHYFWCHLFNVYLNCPNMHVAILTFLNKNKALLNKVKEESVKFKKLMNITIKSVCDYNCLGISSNEIIDYDNNIDISEYYNNSDSNINDISNNSNNKLPTSLKMFGLNNTMFYFLSEDLIVHALICGLKQKEPIGIRGTLDILCNEFLLHEFSKRNRVLLTRKLFNILTLRDMSYNKRIYQIIESSYNPDVVEECIKIGFNSGIRKVPCILNYLIDSFDGMFSNILGEDIEITFTSHKEDNHTDNVRDTRFINRNDNHSQSNINDNIRNNNRLNNTNNSKLVKNYSAAEILENLLCFYKIMIHLIDKEEMCDYLIIHLFIPSMETIYFHRNNPKIADVIKYFNIFWSTAENDFIWLVLLRKIYLLVKDFNNFSIKQNKSIVNESFDKKLLDSISNKNRISDIDNDNNIIMQHHKNAINNVNKNMNAMDDISINDLNNNINNNKKIGKFNSDTDNANAIIDSTHTTNRNNRDIGLNSEGVKLLHYLDVLMFFIRNTEVGNVEKIKLHFVNLFIILFEDIKIVHKLQLIDLFLYFIDKLSKLNISLNITPDNLTINDIKAFYETMAPQYTTKVKSILFSDIIYRCNQLIFESSDLNIGTKIMVFIVKKFGIKAFSNDFYTRFLLFMKSNLFLLYEGDNTFGNLNKHDKCDNNDGNTNKNNINDNNENKILTNYSEKINNNFNLSKHRTHINDHAIIMRICLIIHNLVISKISINYIFDTKEIFYLLLDNEKYEILYQLNIIFNRKIERFIIEYISLDYIKNTCNSYEDHSIDHIYNNNYNRIGNDVKSVDNMCFGNISNNEHSDINNNNSIIRINKNGLNCNNSIDNVNINQSNNNNRNNFTKYSSSLHLNNSRIRNIHHLILFCINKKDDFYFFNLFIILNHNLFKNNVSNNNSANNDDLFFQLVSGLYKFDKICAFIINVLLKENSNNDVDKNVSGLEILLILLQYSTKFQRFLKNKCSFKKNIAILFDKYISAFECNNCTIDDKKYNKNDKNINDYIDKNNNNNDNIFKNLNTHGEVFFSIFLSLFYLINDQVFRIKSLEIMNLMIDSSSITTENIIKFNFNNYIKLLVNTNNLKILQKSKPLIKLLSLSTSSVIFSFFNRIDTYLSIYLKILFDMPNISLKSKILKNIIVNISDFQNLYDIIDHICIYKDIFDKNDIFILITLVIDRVSKEYVYYELFKFDLSDKYADYHTNINLNSDNNNNNNKSDNHSNYIGDTAIKKNITYKNNSEYDINLHKNINFNTKNMHQSTFNNKLCPVISDIFKYDQYEFIEKVSSNSKLKGHQREHFILKNTRIFSVDDSVGNLNKLMNKYFDLEDNLSDLSNNDNIDLSDKHSNDINTTKKNDNINHINGDSDTNNMSNNQKDNDAIKRNTDNQNTHKNTLNDINTYDKSFSCFLKKTRRNIHISHKILKKLSDSFEQIFYKIIFTTDPNLILFKYHKQKKQLITKIIQIYGKDSSSYLKKLQELIPKQEIPSILKENIKFIDEIFGYRGKLASIDNFVWIFSLLNKIRKNIVEDPILNTITLKVIDSMLFTIQRCMKADEKVALNMLRLNEIDKIDFVDENVWQDTLFLSNIYNYFNKKRDIDSFLHVGSYTNTLNQKFNNNLDHKDTITNNEHKNSINTANNIDIHTSYYNKYDPIYNNTDYNPINTNKSSRLSIRNQHTKKDLDEIPQEALYNSIYTDYGIYCTEHNSPKQKELLNRDLTANLVIKSFNQNLYNKINSLNFFPDKLNATDIANLYNESTIQEHYIFNIINQCDFLDNYNFKCENKTNIAKIHNEADNSNKNEAFFNYYNTKNFNDINELEILKPNKDLNINLHPSVVQKNICKDILKNENILEIFLIYSLIQLTPLINEFKHMKIQNLSVNLITALFMIINKAKNTLYHFAFITLFELSKIKTTTKLWKKYFTDLIISRSFLDKNQQLMNLKIEITKNLLKDDISIMEQLFEKLETSFFTSKENELTQRIQTIKRISFLIYCGKKSTFEKYLPKLLEIISEYINNGNLIIKKEIYMLIKQCIDKFKPPKLIILWPTIFADIHILFENLISNTITVDIEYLSVILSVIETVIRFKKHDTIEFVWNYCLPYGVFSQDETDFLYSTIFDVLNKVVHNNNNTKNDNKIQNLNKNTYTDNHIVDNRTISEAFYYVRKNKILSTSTIYYRKIIDFTFNKKHKIIKDFLLYRENKSNNAILKDLSNALTNKKYILENNTIPSNYSTQFNKDNLIIVLPNDKIHLSKYKYLNEQEIEDFLTFLSIYYKNIDLIDRDHENNIIDEIDRNNLS
ncbi:hypothetical protein EDEG_03872 [Edhazardia aedis USNM 41457]|uniref:DOP1 N-terminal domain-containing protein n=1 Tax=Edhazardia aedis (strain USNM 41457) TaxID=1003232 RepID=J9DJQ8_EDHAE|nr:hypothetical protein EDEG_03872 [Edhazardia aedis USNM 41457]|eukprot:EJW01572.1 hypothetical protein EDEG_03872 [Edhazardia aedis USNM 41457]